MNPWKALIAVLALCPCAFAILPQDAPWPDAASYRMLLNPIRVKGTFDGNNTMYYGLGDGGQGENQPPMFILEDGALLKNVLLGHPAGDGVHCLGSCRVLNTWWLDVGEDALTAEGADPGTQVVIDGGGARLADDKVVQHNGGGTVIIKNFRVHDAGKLYRSCGNCRRQFRRSVIVRHVRASNTKVLVGVNVGDNATISDVVMSGKRCVVCARFLSAKPGQKPRRVPGSCHQRGVSIKCSV